MTLGPGAQDGEPARKSRMEMTLGWGAPDRDPGQKSRTEMTLGWGAQDGDPGWKSRTEMTLGRGARMGSPGQGAQGDELTVGEQKLPRACCCAPVFSLHTAPAKCHQLLGTLLRPHPTHPSSSSELFSPLLAPSTP